MKFAGAVVRCVVSVVVLVTGLTALSTCGSDERDASGAEPQLLLPSTFDPVTGRRPVVLWFWAPG